MSESSYRAYEFEQITVSNAVKAFDLSKVEKTSFDKGDRVVCTLENADVRFRIDGGEPSATVGHLFYRGDELIIDRYEDIKRARFFRDAAVDATMTVTYERLVCD